MKEVMARELLKKKVGRGIDLQLFAGEGEGQGEGSKEGEGDAGKNDDPPAGKTFTQEEVNAMMAKEKNQGKLAILKELGVEDSKTAKEALAKYKEYLDSQKTEAQKLAEDLKVQQEAKASAEQKATLLERKFEAVALGAPANAVEDIVTLASTKVTDTKDFKTALEEVKAAYPQLFETSSGNTGNNVGSKKIGGNGIGSFGKKIAESASKAQSSGNGYFTN